ncbi:MAG: xylanase [SAR86 cluster bacterium]|uniref:Xylanase n=1 Tax=SAR86 cluster bacterium TaxID=2030880 RepID=A0A2A5BAT4_9GAMM|nr:MAG: xylanase [SAR86 cluster bacterium]
MGYHSSMIIKDYRRAPTSTRVGNSGFMYAIPINPLSFLLFVSSLVFALLPEPTQANEHGVILLYHHVATDTPPSTSISPSDFEGHLQYLKDHNYNVIALDVMIQSLKSGQALPDKAVAITFDDGYSSIYTTAFPLLKSFDYPFSLFLSTGPINNNQTNYMNWDQVREMANEGVLIGNHMVEHPYMLERTDGESEQQWLGRLRNELLEAEETIRNETGQTHHYLAYPYGEYNPAIKQMLSELSFVGLAQNSGAVGINSDFLALPRFPLASIYANIETASTKFSTLSFNMKLIEPLSPVTLNRSPRVTLQFQAGNFIQSQIACFANSRPIPMTWLDIDAGILELAPEEKFTGRRWRYICTAPDSGSTRYFWNSVQWINLN